MKRCRGLLLLAAFLIVGPIGCGGSGGGKVGDAIDVDGDGKPDGKALDLNGDGRVDAIDVDGDGKPDGEDVDGDGVITIWANLQTGDVPVTPQETAHFVAAVDPDLFVDLDPEHPPRGIGDDGFIVVPDAVSFGPTDFPVLNQGSLGSCAAFANTETAAILNTRFRSMPSDDLPSPAFMYARQLEASMSDCDKGTRLHDGLNTLVREGAPTITEVPYNEMCVNDPPNSNGSAFRIGGWAFLEPFDRERVKKALAIGLVLPFGASLPSNFQDFKGPPAQEVFHSAQGQLGNKHGSGHAMVIVGYDDQRRAYRVLNSWGADWGDHGYIWWDYDDLEARDGLHALVPLPLPVPMVLMQPDPDSFTVSAVGAVADPVDDVIAVRLKTSEPVHIAQLVFDRDTVALDQWLAYGDVTFPLKNRPPGTYNLSVSGTLRDKSQVSRTLMVTVE